MLEIYKTTYTENKEELYPLFKKHWEEINPDLPAFKPNDNIYLGMEAFDQYFGVIARLDSEIVGYLSIMMYHHYHCQDLSIAYTDAFYVSPEHRGDGTAVKMFKFAEHLLRSEYKVDVFNFSCDHHKDLTNLAIKLGFKSSNKVFEKRL